MTSRGSHDIPDSKISWAIFCSIFIYRYKFFYNFLHRDFSILLSCFKVLLGCNVFLLPLCFKYSGLLWGSIQLIIFGLLFAYCAHTLLSCANFIAARDDVSILSYGKLAYLAIKNGPPVLTEWANNLEVIVRIFQTLYTILICGIYMHIITLHLIQLGYSKTDPIDISVHIWAWNAVTALALFFICFIPSTYLYIFAIIGIISQFSSLIVCYAVYVFTDFKAEPEYFSYSPASITYTMALATYLFEGINVILPFRNQVQNKIRFTRYVFAIIITITGLSLFVGIFGFIRFDYLVYPCITLHVPANTTYVYPFTAKGTKNVLVLIKSPELVKWWNALQACHYY